MFAYNFEYREKIIQSPETFLQSDSDHHTSSLQVAFNLSVVTAGNEFCIFCDVFIANCMICNKRLPLQMLVSDHQVHKSRCSDWVNWWQVCCTSREAVKQERQEIG